MNNRKWIGVIAVAVIAGAIVFYKARVHQPEPTPADLPRVLLVADLGEADKPGDRCAEIIQAVRQARARGVAVQEYRPDSTSPLLSRYRVLTAPTVIILDARGEVVSRHEGEAPQTVAAIRTALDHVQ